MRRLTVLTGVHAVAEQAAKADDLVDEAIDVEHGRSEPLVTHAMMLRLELLKVKADLERGLEDFSLKLLEVRPRCSLGERAGRLTRTLGPRGGGTARRGGGLTPTKHGTPRMRETYRSSWRRLDDCGVLALR
jgi:hypothetical protein